VQPVDPALARVAGCRLMDPSADAAGQQSDSLARGSRPRLRHRAHVSYRHVYSRGTVPDQASPRSGISMFEKNGIVNGNASATQCRSAAYSFA
jgi:hypothetical protein